MHKNSLFNNTIVLFIVLLILLPACSGALSGEIVMIHSSERKKVTSPLRVSRENPRYFTDNSGKAIYLTGSHTWRNFKDIGKTDPPTPFDYKKHLNILKKYNHNFIRLWNCELFKYSHKGVSYVTPFPWKRTGPGIAADGMPKFNLELFDQTYFERLRERIIAARDQGMYVGIMLFEGFGLGTDSPLRWEGHPFNPKNNINLNIDADTNKDTYAFEIHTMQIPEIIAIEEKYVKKVIDEVNDLDNVLYEISNEDHSGSAEWQYYMIDFIHNYEKTKPKQHPVGLTPAAKMSKNTIFDSKADWVSPEAPQSAESDATHPYNLNPPATTGNKVVIIDTDHLKFAYTHRRDWVWRTFLRGYNPINMDNMASDPVREEVRIAMGQTLTYADKVDLSSMTPGSSPSECSTTYCLRNPGKEYLVYQPKSDFMSNIVPPVVTVDLKAGEYIYEWFHPDSGRIIPGEAFSAQDGQRTFRQPFRGDAVLYIYRP